MILATHNREAFLGELFQCLEALEEPGGGLELVVADDGSDDGTWAELKRLVSASPLPALALRLPRCGGPSVPRNTAVGHSRGQYLLLTDDDCLPQPGWARELARALDGGAAVVQGETRPSPEGPSGVWDRTISVPRFSGMFETCNLGFRRDPFIVADGFPVIQAIKRSPRGFGEDALLGRVVHRSGDALWVPEALVHHRWLATTFAQHLEGRRRLAGFPFLVSRDPSLRELLWRRFFLTRRSAAFDLAALGGAGAVVLRRPLLLLAVLPWCGYALREARARPGRPLLWRLAQVAVADATAFASLAAGSVKHRRAVL